MFQHLLLLKKNQKLSTIKWNGRSFEEISTFKTPDGADIDYKQTEQWSLSDDGKTLTLKVLIETNGESRSMKGIYEKS